MKSFLLFNNKGGAGKTTLVFNLAHMLARQGRRVVVIDYDPQCNITAIFLEDEELAEIWDAPAAQGRTVFACLDPVRIGNGDMRSPRLHQADDNLWLLPGNMELSRFEQTLAEEWPKKFAVDNERALNVTAALDQLSNLAAAEANADFVLFDVGPSLGALNRSALLSSDAVIMPIAPDLFSVRGLRNVGPAFRDWRKEWRQTCDSHMKGRVQAGWPRHGFQPIGYIVQQHIARADRPVKAYRDWLKTIPGEYHEAILSEKRIESELAYEQDRECLGMLRHFASLAPYAQMARKPMFDLKTADGVGGGQLLAVSKSHEEFRKLADRIVERLDRLPDLSVKPMKEK